MSNTQASNTQPSNTGVCSVRVDEVPALVLGLVGGQVVEPTGRGCT